MGRFHPYPRGGPRASQDLDFNDDFGVCQYLSLLYLLNISRPRTEHTGSCPVQRTLVSPTFGMTFPRALDVL